MRNALIGLLIIVSFIQANAEDKPHPLNQKFSVLQNEYGAAQQVLRGALDRAGDGNERKAVLKRHEERKQELGTLALKLARDTPKDPAAVDVLTWILRLRVSPLTPAVLEILARDHIDSDDVLKSCLHNSRAPGRDIASVERFLRELIAKSHNRRVKGLTCFYLAGFLNDRAEEVRHLEENPKDLSWYQETYGIQGLEQYLARDANALARESEQLYEKIIVNYADLATLSGDSLGTRARGELFEARNLSVGRVAPEIEGQDVDGVRFKLSDSRGRVVLLTFSATWCGPCRAMYPQERALVERLKGKPFAILSVNAEEDAGALRKAIKSREITWQCWYDRGPNGSGSGPICMRLGINSFPTMLLLDRDGVIRYKGVHGAKMDEAVDQLLEEIDRAA